MDAQAPNRRDIDQMTAAVKQHIPEVIISQLQTKHASDDTGLWWFGLPEGSHDVQAENTTGMGPFLIATAMDQACTAHAVEETVQMIVAHLMPLRRTAHGLT